MRRQEIQQTFGATVRTLRSAAGLTQETLAATARLDRSYIGAVERGERNVTLVSIVRIAAALRVSPALLLERLGR